MWSSRHCGTGTKTDTDQWNRIENPEVDPELYGQLVSDKARKTIHWKKQESLQSTVLGKLDSHVQKNETRSFSYTKHKIN